jgi:thiol-disulfide isomerase/thioredoxin
MMASDTGRRKRPTAAVYALAAILAAAAGFVAVYVSLTGLGNGEAPRVPAPVAGATGPSAPAPAAPAASGPFAGLNVGKMAAFVVRGEPQALPAFTFNNADGEETTLADWKGRVVLLNLWATWCAPCRKEMPALDRLDAALGGDGFDVVAIASERGGADKPKQFLAEIEARHLAFYHDPTAKLPAILKVFGMPTTLLLDRRGNEIGRLVGPAEWDSPEAGALLKAAIADKDG